MANEPEAASPATKPAVKKFMYKSPLSGIRSAPYKPPVDKSGFNPIGVSSPKRPNDSEGDRFAINIPGPQQSKSPIVENNQFNERRPDTTQNQTGDSPVVNVNPSLRGRGGHWRGPHGNMTPDTRRRGGRHRGYNSSPNVEGNSGYWFSPVPNLDNSHELSFGHKPYRQNSFGTNSFSSNQRTPDSPYEQVNSSNNSAHSNSRRKNRGGGHSHRNNGGIEVFYSPSMKEDPWSSLMKERLNMSFSESKTPTKTCKSLFNVTSDSEVDEGISSQGNDTPVGDDSS